MARTPATSQARCGNAAVVCFADARGGLRSALERRTSPIPIDVDRRSPARGIARAIAAGAPTQPSPRASRRRMSLITSSILAWVLARSYRVVTKFLPCRQRCTRWIDFSSERDHAFADRAGAVKFVTICGNKPRPPLRTAPGAKPRRLLRTSCRRPAPRRRRWSRCSPEQGMCAWPVRPRAKEDSPSRGRLALPVRCFGTGGIARSLRVRRRCSDRPAGARLRSPRKHQTQRIKRRARRELEEKNSSSRASSERAATIPMAGDQRSVPPRRGSELRHRCRRFS